jgi:hypothetical protein
VLRRIQICSLLLFAILGFWFQQSTYAASEDLLSGLPFYNENNTATYAITDNDLSTRAEWGWWYPASKAWSITLPNTANIKSFSVTVYPEVENRRNTIIGVFFYDAGNNLIYSTNTANALVYGTNNITHDINNVATIVFGGMNINSNTNLIGDFKIFGAYNLQAPINFQGNAGSKSVILSWDKLNDNKLLGYNVYKSGEKIADRVQDNFYIATGLAPDITDEYYVTAVYESGESGPSQKLLLTPLADPLAKPVLKASQHETSLSISWNDVGAVRYYLYRALDQYIMSTTGTSYEMTGLEPEQDHSLYLIAEDKYGRLVQSDIVTFRTVKPPEPLIPVVTASKINYNSIDLSWQHYSDSGYEVLNDQDVLLGTSVFNRFTVKDLLPETNYSFKIRYTDKYNRIVESDIAAFKTTGIPPPSILTLSKVSQSHDYVILSWNRTGQNYNLYRDDQLIASDLTMLSYKVANLEGNTDYSFKVKTIDQFGRELESNVLAIRTAPPPPPPEPRPPKQPPPPVSDSGNAGLDKANDHLVQGPKDLSKSYLSLIMAIVLLLILVVGIAFLMKIFKKKVNKTTARRSSNQASTLPIPTNQSKLYRNYVNSNKNHAYKGQRRKKHYVQKNS